MEEWVTWTLLRRAVIVCDKCSKIFTYPKVHMYVNVDNEVEEVLYEKCWDETKNGL